jgi:hypothetical protein
MSSFSHKIDEWMREAEARPESAVTIVRLIARRLGELTARNEELLAENIALQNGTRVEEYQKRIAHLEYQLDLLKRRFGTDESLLSELPAVSVEASITTMVGSSALKSARMFRNLVASSTRLSKTVNSPVCWRFLPMRKYFYCLHPGESAPVRSIRFQP